MASMAFLPFRPALRGSRSEATRKPYSVSGLGVANVSRAPFVAGPA